MEHSLDTPSSSIDTSPLENLLGRMTQLELATDELDKGFAAFVESLDEATKQTFEEVYDAYYDIEEDEETLSMSEYWRTRGRGLLPVDMIQNLKEFEAAHQEWKLLTEELDQRFGQDLSQYVRDEARALLVSVDPEKARHYEHWERDQPNRDWSTELSYILSGLSGLAEMTPVPNYHQSSIDFDRVQKYRELLEEKGVLGSGVEPKEILHDPEELQRAQDLRVRYRGDFYGQPLDEALKLPLLPSHDYKVKLDYEQLEALEQHLRSVDIDAQLEELDIKGLDTLPFTLSSGALKYMLRVVPALAFEGVDAIEFRDISQDEQDAARVADFWEGRAVTAGHHAHVPSVNRARIVINSRQVASTYQYIIESVPNAVIARHIALEQMMNTVFHEFGHALHYKLPVTLLHSWDKAAEGEDVYVSAYVEQKATHHGVEEARGEDFADSFMLFLTKPDELRVSSSERYAAMKDIYSMTTIPVPVEDWWRAPSPDS